MAGVMAVVWRAMVRWPTTSPAFFDSVLSTVFKRRLYTKGLYAASPLGVPHGERGQDAIRRPDSRGNGRLNWYSVHVTRIEDPGVHVKEYRRRCCRNHLAPERMLGRLDARQAHQGRKVVEHWNHRGKKDRVEWNKRGGVTSESG